MKQLVEDINSNITNEFPLAPDGQPVVSPCFDAWMSVDRRILLLAHSSTKLDVVSAIGQITPKLTSDMAGSWLSIRPVDQ